MAGDTRTIENMFQQWLAINPHATRMYAGLYPTGAWADPCLVKCSACTYTATAPNWTEAARLAFAHDWKHDQRIKGNDE